MSGHQILIPVYLRPGQLTGYAIIFFNTSEQLELHCLGMLYDILMLLWGNIAKTPSLLAVWRLVGRLVLDELFSNVYYIEKSFSYYHDLQELTSLLQYNSKQTIVGAIRPSKPGKNRARLIHWTVTFCLIYTLQYGYQTCCSYFLNWVSLSFL